MEITQEHIKSARREIQQSAIKNVRNENEREGIIIATTIMAMQLNDILKARSQKEVDESMTFSRDVMKILNDSERCEEAISQFQKETGV